MSTFKRFEISPLTSPGPISKLPLEIITEIFMHSLPSPQSWDNYFNSALSGRSAPLVLTWTCSQWRSLAMASPALWSTFYVYLSHGYSKKVYSQAQLLDISREWLGRAADRELSIGVCAEGSSERLKHLWSIIEENCSRIASLWVTFFSPAQGVAIHAEGLSFPRLQSLGILLDCSDDEDTTLILPSDQALTTFATCPLLERLALSGVPHTSLQLPYEQITWLSVDYLYFEEFIECLDAMPNLRKCYLTGAAFGRDAPPEVTHRNLQLLDINSYDDAADYDADDHTTFALELLTLPSLETLKLRFDYGFKGMPGLFQSFVERSSPPLRVLWLSSAYLKQESDYIHFKSHADFEAICPVRSIRIEKPHTKLLPRLFQRHCYPVLEEIELVDCDISYLWEITMHVVDGICDGLGWGREGPYKSVRVFFNKPFYGVEIVPWIGRATELYDKIQQIRSAGTEIYIGTDEVSMIQGEKSQRPKAV
ncbi:F-box domain-containing protein [Mycena kentingensis (nom. inval.)]|nr:F-box domain-containing protein [Mycena kentingensis (nom. inval.)]